MKISPSILSADFANLQAEINSVKNADMIHIDVMDGIFVPNITVGLPVVESLKKVTDLLLDVHLMITQPERYIPRFAQAGADIITFHAEATDNIETCLNQILTAGKKPAIAIKPDTDISVLEPYKDQLYMALIMTVEPGFGGQKLIEKCLDKSARLKQAYPDLRIQADGGLNLENMARAKSCGIDIAVVGSALFGAENRAETIERLKNI